MSVIFRRMLALCVLALPLCAWAAPIPFQEPANAEGNMKRRLAHDGPVYDVVFSPDGRRLISAGEDGLVRLWDLATGKEVRRFTGHKGGVLALALTADGKTLATAGRDGTVRLWNTATGKELRKFTGRSGEVHSLALSADGRYLAAVLNPRNGRLLTSPPALVPIFT